jgi:hypothetical protein
LFAEPVEVTERAAQMIYTDPGRSGLDVRLIRAVGLSQVPIADSRRNIPIVVELVARIADDVARLFLGLYKTFQARISRD